MLQFLYHCCKQNKFLGQLISGYLNKNLYLQQEDVFQNFSNRFITSGKNFYSLHIESPHASFVRERNNIYCNDQKSVIGGGMKWVKMVIHLKIIKMDT